MVDRRSGECPISGLPLMSLPRYGTDFCICIDLFYNLSKINTGINLFPIMKLQDCGILGQEEVCLCYAAPQSNKCYCINIETLLESWLISLVNQ